MGHIGPQQGLPIACTLTPDAGRAQVEKWRAFNAEYSLGVDRSDDELVVRYEKTDESERRLRKLVAAENSCCSFVDWVIDGNQSELGLIVTGTPGQLAALGIGSSGRSPARAQRRQFNRTREDSPTCGHVVEFRFNV